MKKKVVKKTTTARIAKPGIITVCGVGKIPIAEGHLIRVRVLGANTYFHITNYDGKNIEVFIGGPAELVNVETPK